MLAALIGRSLGRARYLLLGLAGLLGGFQLMIVVIAAEIERTQTFSMLAALLPQFIQSLTGGLVFGSFAGLTSLGFVHPIVVLVLVEAAIFLGSEPAGEVEAGLVDLTMARPVPRGLVVVRTAILACGATAVLLLLMVVSMRLSLHALAPAGVVWPRLRTIALLASNLMAVAWWFGALSLLVSAVVRRRSIAIGVAGLLAVSLYLFHVMAEMSASLQRYRPFTPFHYFNSALLVRGSAQEWSRDVALLVATAALLGVAAWRAYTRRDL